MLIKSLLKLTMLIRTLFLLVSRLPSQVAQWVKNPLAIGRGGFDPWVGRSPGGRTATHSSILAWRIPMDRGTWWAIAHKVAKGRT